MDQYPTPHLADIHFVYGLADGNGREAQRLYQQRFPMRRLPHYQFFTRIHNRLRETGSLQAHNSRVGRPRTVRTPEVEDAILDRFHNNPSTSTRAVSSAEGVGQQIVHKVARDDGMYPYHFQTVHKLKPEDRPLRMNFSNFVIGRIAEDPTFLGKVLFTDETTFPRDGYFNIHNNHEWSHENPHVSTIQGNQVKMSVNVWAGIIGDHLIGPYILPARLNGQTYLRFLQEVLPELLEDVPLQTRAEMWFQHDGAPAHWFRAVREHLNAVFPGRWIGRGSHIGWPARSPDLTPLDFFLWGYFKDLIYDGTEIESEEDLVARIAVAAGSIRDRAPDIFGRM